MDSPEISRTSLINLTLVIEGLLLLAAAGWIYFHNISLISAFTFQPLAIGLGVLVGLSTTLLSLAGYVIGKHWKLFSGLRKLTNEIVVPLIATLGFADLIIISLASGFCEEVLFRGLIQKETNLFATSVVFGLFHDPSFRHLSYILAATVGGLILGFLYLKTGNLWAPITAHIVHNTLSLIVIRYKLKPLTSV